MNTFDDELRQGLSADDQAFLKSLEDEPGLFTQMGDAFSGSMKFWTAFAFLLSLILFGVSLWAVWNAFQTDDLKTVMLWLALALWASIAVELIKIWFWLRMNHLQYLRELKIISMQLAQGR